MLEILPIKLLSDDDSLIFGRLNVDLGKLYRYSLPIADGLVISPPMFTIQTVLNHFILGNKGNSFVNKELIQQSLTLVKKDLERQPIPEELIKEGKKDHRFFVDGKTFTDLHSLWMHLVDSWLEEIKQRIWQTGFSPEIAKNLTPKIVSYVKKVSAFGEVYFDEITGEIVVDIKLGTLTPEQHKNLENLTIAANKKLLIHHSYQWVLDTQIKLVNVSFYTPREDTVIIKKSPHEIVSVASNVRRNIGVTKVFLDLSNGFVIEKDVDGAFIAAEKMLDLNKKDDSFEELLFKLTETATTLIEKPVLFKLPDIPENRGGIRGTFRLLHQDSLLHPLIKAIKFLKEEKKLENIQLVVPFLRHSSEYSALKKQLADQGVHQSHNLQYWVEFAVAENLLNLDEYIKAGIDGVVLNLDELIGSLYGFNHTDEQINHLKKEITGLTKFLEGYLKDLKKAKIPLLVYGGLLLDVSLLEFLIHHGVTGIIVERYEALSMTDLLSKIEKKMALKRINS